MVFSSLFFLFFFLPIVLVVYYAVPYKVQNIILLVASIIFYAWGEPVYVVLMLFSCVFNWLVGMEMGQEPQRAKGTLIFGIAVNVLMLGFFKYWGFLLGVINSIPFVNIPYHELALPVGISFFTFQAISYLIDVYRGDAEVQRNILDFSLYLAMFPQLIAGPIVKYHDIAEQLRNKRISASNFSGGLQRFVIGLGKKVILANNLGNIYDTVCALDGSDMSVVAAWIGILCYTLQIYFDFSGYSDMAIGLGRMFGFEFLENFNYPYIAKSITDFWRRWHISLSTWFRNYIYIPLGGNRVKPSRHIFNILVVWTLTGFWHGAAWNFMLWGFFYGLVLLVEKYVLKGVLEKLPAPVCHLYTMIIVIIGWVFFSQPSFGATFSYLGSMFGIGTALANGACVQFIRTALVPLILGAVCATPWPWKKFQQLQESKRVLCVVLQVALFVLCISFLVFDSYNPFLYFRF